MTQGSNKRPVLEVERRNLLGKKVKRLRKEGKLPANIYGRNIKSLAVTADLAQVSKVFSQVGETGLVDLKVNGERKVRPVLLHNPQYDPITDQLIHIDFYQVDLKKKVTAEVPIKIVGEAVAVEKGKGVLVQILNEIEVEALPTDLPEYFEVDVSSLKKPDDAVLVENLKMPEEVEVKTNPKQVIVKIEKPKEEEEEEVEKPEETEAEAGEAAEKKEGEPKQEEKSEQEKQQPQQQLKEEEKQE